MFSRELARRAEAVGVVLDATQIEAFSVYNRELAAASAKFNLTAIPPARYLDEHFIDSLTLVQTNKLFAGQRCCDIGSGAGLPGLAVKIAIPGMAQLLIESNAKKAEFMRAVISKLRLEGAEVYNGRAEEAGRDADMRGLMDIALARAVAPLSVLLEYALPLLKVGGWFLAMKGPKASSEAVEAEAAVAQLGGHIETVLSPYGVDAGSRRVIVMVQKTGTTDSIFPRKTGIPKKRPLGG